MKFTLSWLKFFLDTEASITEISQKLTMIGLEVEQVIDHNIILQNFKIAKIVSVIPHPNADKLKVCQVETGKNTDYLQIICGADNARAGIKVVLAEIGAIIPNGQFRIKAAEIRGIKSYGMLCSEEELSIGNNCTEGIIELPETAVVGESFLKYYGLDDPVIDIAVTPNRGDCLGVYGIARDLAATGLGALKQIDILTIPTKSNITSSNARVKQLYTREIINLNNQASPDWLKNLLKNIGLTPVSAIVDITNYISYSFARPLHAYDKNKVVGELKAATASLNQRFRALNNREYILTNTDLIITDDNNEMQALAGIIGSYHSACSTESTNIILEAASFDKISITKTARRLDINTDARYRFERHVDPNFTIQGLELATKMIIEICGGRAMDIVAQVTDNSAVNNSTNHITFNLAEIKQKIGIDIPEAAVLDILTKLGFEISKDIESSNQQSNRVIHLKVPSWRADITMTADIVEEIIRIYGYDKISATPLPSNEFLATRLISNTQRHIVEAKKLLATRGLYEIYSWSFMDSKKAALFTTLRDELYIANPIASNLDYMRSSLLPNLLEIVVKNQARSLSDFGLFEIGPVFQGLTELDEKTVIGAVRVGKFASKTPFNEVSQTTIYDSKLDLQMLLNEFNLDIDKLQIDLAVPEYFHPSRAAVYKLGKVVIANVGEIHPEILNIFGITDRVNYLEIFLNNMPEAKNRLARKAKYIVSDYQPSKRDFAFLVDEKLPAGELIRFIKNLEKHLIKHVHIFDIFQGKNIEYGKKSIALTVLIQALDRTLTETDLQNICKKLIYEVEHKFAAKVRDGM